jgi:hypothetical protein
MINTLTAERAEQRAALSVLNGNGGTQSGLGLTEQVYCPVHGVVKTVWGQCETCFDEGLADWDATRVAKELIPDWTGINPDGRQVIVARVRDALDAVQKISQYKNSDAIVLIVWDSLVTALDGGKIGPNWTVSDVSEILDVECVRCCQPFVPIDDEQLCEQCSLAEYGPRR